MNYEGLKSSDRIEDGAQDSLVPVSVSEVSNLFLAVVLAVLICGILPSIPEDLVHFFFVPVFFVLPFHDSLCCPVFYKDWLMKEKEDIVTRLIQSKMKKKNP